jgi:hypothetical protein
MQSAAKPHLEYRKDAHYIASGRIYNSLNGNMPFNEKANLLRAGALRWKMKIVS